jgi:xylan 1,4-beta-xylosidase
MGSPASPTPEQQEKLVAAGQLTLLGSPEWIKVEGGKLALNLSMPRQSVSLLRLTWNPRSGPVR